MKIAREYTEDGFAITEYTSRNNIVSHIVKVASSDETIVVVPKISINEQILYENQYQTMLLEMGGMM